MDKANENDVSCFRRGIYFILLFFSVKVFENTAKICFAWHASTKRQTFWKDCAALLLRCKKTIKATAQAALRG